MSTFTTSVKYPRLRHCTLIEKEDTNSILMIVGSNYFEIDEEMGSREKFLEVKSYFDGRHSIKEISNLTEVSEEDLISIVTEFEEMGLLRSEESVHLIKKEDFINQIEESCIMWAQQIGYHRLFGQIESGEARKEVFQGYILETYHYVKSARKHISTALAHCTNDHHEELLTDFFNDEYNHYPLMLESLERMGIPKDRVESAHPIIGTMSLINMLCEIGRQSTLAYIACTSLFEAREEDFEQSKTSLERLAEAAGFKASDVAPVIEHMRGDVEADHNSLLEEALADIEYINAEEAHFAVNCLHDLKHSFDQFHDQILEYYSDISNYIPRLKVDYFSL
ncbi:Pyrroloquinoline quinone (PQQ) biosynthesis protein C [Alteribacillus persepolensis]|uniref:Aminopyrimidine aminohydrolase n=1 Tax=Alteribacillus persepolensis TaxID=568899 RepID=A0A1G8FXD6_9BACI|nr:iron-containing redox enzyme family protein [Alteribacillus persepolensis]SDH86818.1 Pyrroloquinoline quinone (PQQ) biosynthesis protein C [Alteribacillus persepolensis]